MQTNNNIVMMNINLIIPNRYQPRKVFDEIEIKTLADSIKEYGILNPILVRKKEDQYEIIAGERRYRAAKMLGIDSVPVVIKTVTEQQMAELALIENIQRKDLSPIEEAKSYEEIIQISNQTQEELAKKIGKSQSSIANKIRLLSLPQEVQDALINRKISERHARSLLTLDEKEKQLEYLNKIIEEKLTVKETEQLINQKQITEEEIKQAINDIMKSLNIAENQEENQEKEEKEDDNMNNGNFFPNFDNNNTSLNMMNMQSMTPNYVEPQNEMVMPTPNIMATPMNNTIQFNEPQVEIPAMTQNPFDFNNVEPTSQIDASFSQPNQFINQQPNFNIGFAEPTREELPLYQQTYGSTVEPVIIQENQNVMQDTPLFNPSAFEVPVANETIVEQDRLSKLQELLNTNGYNYKLFSNETDNCIIIELSKN